MTLKPAGPAPSPPSAGIAVATSIVAGPAHQGG